MIALILKDINGRTLTLENTIRMINEEVYGGISEVRLNQNNKHSFEIRAFGNFKCYVCSRY